MQFWKTEVRKSNNSEQGHSRLVVSFVIGCLWIPISPSHRRPFFMPQKEGDDCGKADGKATAFL